MIPGENVKEKRRKRKERKRKSEKLVAYKKGNS
jgi:hypothetical protein